MPLTLVKDGPSKEEHRRNLHLKIQELRAEYERKIEPLIKELAALAATDPPPPITLPDGRTFQYVGPLPEWKP